MSLPGLYSNVPPYFHSYYDHTDYYDHAESTPEQPQLPAQDSTLSGDTQEQQLTYNLKIINPKRKSQYKVEKFRKCGRFETPGELKSYIMSEFEEFVPRNAEFDIGYYKPRRGSTKMWIKDDEDIQCMYDGYKDEVNLWCEGRLQDEDLELESADVSTSRKKRKKDDDTPVPVSKRQAIRDEVDKLLFELKEEHGSKYTAQQYRLWANMLQIGTWKDTDNPPQTPMFGYNGNKPEKSTSVTDALSSVAEGVMRALKSPTPLRSQSPPTTSRPQLNEVGVSPSKCASLRSQYIEQIKQLHQLLELTAINKDEYEKQKADVLKKMEQL